MIEQMIEQKLASIVGEESAKQILGEYKRTEASIRSEPRSKVMYYQRRKGMKAILEVLGIRSSELEMLTMELSGK